MASQYSLRGKFAEEHKKHGWHLQACLEVGTYRESSTPKTSLGVPPVLLENTCMLFPIDVVRGASKTAKFLARSTLPQVAPGTEVGAVKKVIHKNTETLR